MKTFLYFLIFIYFLIDRSNPTQIDDLYFFINYFSKHLSINNF